MADIIPPTRMNQQVFKLKMKAAEGGHRLLKKKADALKAKFRDYAKEIAATKSGMSEECKGAFFSLTQAEYAAGNFKPKVAESVTTASIRVGAGVNNVAGVKLPVFESIPCGDPNDSNTSLGLVGGGKKIENSRQKFQSLLNSLIKLASLQTSFHTLDEAMKVTNRRVNALENVTIPKIKGVLDYISRELDELEREDFTRLKKVQKSKEEKLAEAEALIKEAKREARELGKILKMANVEEDLLGGFDAGEDKDVVF